MIRFLRDLVAWLFGVPGPTELERRMAIMTSPRVLARIHRMIELEEQLETIEE